MKFYIDESGNTGDLTGSNLATAFGEQPYFALTCIGVNEEAILLDYINFLKGKYKYNAAELKFSKLRNRIGIAFDVLEFLNRESLPLFFEMVDKKFFICRNIVDEAIFQILTPSDFEESMLYLRSKFANIIYENLSDEMFTLYFKAISGSSPDEMIDFLQKLNLEIYNWGSLVDAINNLDVGEFLVDMVQKAIRDLEKYKSTKAVSLLMQSPDHTNKNSKDIWILPHTSSFTNIYARINLFMRGSINNLNIYHDDQVQFSNTMSKYKDLMENIHKLNYPKINHWTDFSFREKANLSFISSGSNIGIQISDVLGGAIAKITTKIIENTISHDSKEINFYRKLNFVEKRADGIGINLVMPDKNLYTIRSFLSE